MKMLKESRYSAGELCKGMWACERFVSGAGAGAGVGAAVTVVATRYSPRTLVLPNSSVSSHSTQA